MKYSRNVYDVCLYALLDIVPENKSNLLVSVLHGRANFLLPPMP